jgi:hypothetical protein
MDVPGVGSGPTGTEYSSAPGAVAGPKGRAVRAAPQAPAVPDDAIGATLRQLSKPDVLRFLEIVERSPSPEIAARLDGVLQASIQAAAEGDVPRALVKLAEFAALDPRRAEALDREPGLASIHREVEQFMSRLASAAHVDAEARLDRAAHLLGAAGAKEPPGQESAPRIAMVVAGRLLEAGGYANCIRSAQLSQALINQYGFAATPVPPVPAEASGVSMDFERALLGWRHRWRPWIGSLWLRAPLLVLLLAWFAAGFAGGSIFALLRSWWPQTWPESLVAGGFEVWGVGFLALVGFGFYARVRGVR